MGGTSVGDSEDANNKHGAPFQYDPDFNGPIKNRGCTDICCLLLFIIFIGGWITVAVFAFMFGNPEKLISPTDSLGNVCGQGDFEDRPVLFFFDITKCAKVTTLVRGCQTPQICVKHCPPENYFPRINQQIYSKKLRDIRQEDREDKILCTYDANPELTVAELTDKNKCAVYVLKSDPVGTDFHRDVLDKMDYPIKNPFVGRCVPLISSLQKAASDFQEHMSDMNVTAENIQKGTKYISRVLDLRNVGEELLEDFKSSWKMILVGLAIATLISFLWIVLMRWLACIMLWMSLFLVLGILGVGCGYSFYRFKELSERTEPPAAFKFTSFSTYGEQKKTWLIVGITLAILLVILLLMIVFLRNRIRLAIALIEESSKAVGNILSSLLFPIIPFILQLVIITFGIAVAIFISSSSIPKHIVSSMPKECKDICHPYKEFSDCQNEEDFNNTCLSKCPDAKCGFLKYEANYLITGAQILNLFGLFWGVFFVIGLGQMVLAGAFASWYWAFDKSTLPTFVITASFCRTLRYHLGSIAFGSILIAIVKMFRALLEYADRKLKEHTDNAVAKCIMCCLKCCFWCLENFIKFINRNAYIMIAVYGKNFCFSAKEAFSLLMRNIARVVVLDKVTDFLLFLGKLTIVGFIASLSFLFVTGKLVGLKYLVDGGLNYMAFPVVIICAGSYVIASCFFSVYNMAVDTLFLCFLEDCEMNDGSQEKPYRMSKNLMKILGKQNAKLVDPIESNTK